MSRSFGFVSCGDEVVEAFLLSEEVADGTDGFPEVIVGSGSSFPEQGLELGEGHFDGVQVEAVGRQRQEPAADILEHLRGLRAFVAGQVVQDDHVAGLQGRGELVSAYVFVESGTVNADMGYLATVDPGGTLGTTAVTFVQFTGAGQILAGAGLTKSGNTLDVGAGTGIAVAADRVGLTGQVLAVHNLATNGLVARTAAATVAARSIAVSGTGLAVANGDGVAANPTLSLAAALASVGALTPAADRIGYYTGAATAALATLTAFARTLLDDADAATSRATLGLGTLATQDAAAVTLTGGSLNGFAIDGGTF